MGNQLRSVRVRVGGLCLVTVALWVLLTKKLLIL